MNIDIEKLSIEEAHKKLLAGDFSAVDLATTALESAKEADKQVDAYLEFFDDVLDQARLADKMISDGKATSLTGIPLAIKDNILIEGKRASGASKILEGYIATYDASVIKKLKEQGAVFLGRTNMDEFAMGSSTENSGIKQTKNPHDSSRVPGGSSGGSAAAVSLGTLGALGSDTGGSIRQPASFCGLVGLKPTYGSVSRFGLMAMGSSLDQIGPLTHTVEDAKILFDVIRGNDPKDSTSLPDEFFAKQPSRVPKTIGVPREFLKEGIDKDVLERFESTLEHLSTQGYSIVDISLPHAPYALPTYYVIMPAEVSSNLGR